MTLPQYLKLAELKTVVEKDPMAYRSIAMTALRSMLLLAGVLFVGVGSPGLSLIDFVVGVVYLLTVTALSSAFWWTSRYTASRLLVSSFFLDGLYVHMVHQRVGHELATDVMIAAVLVAVCLLTSFTIGLTMVLWHTFLMVLMWQLGGVEDSIGTVPSLTALIFDIALAWFVVSVTTVAASISERELKGRRYDAESLQILASDLLRDDEPDNVTTRLMTWLREELLIPRAVIVEQRTLSGSLRVVGSFGCAAGVGSVSTHESAILQIVASSENRFLSLCVTAGSDPWIVQLLPGAQHLGASALARDGARILILLVDFGNNDPGRLESRAISTAAQASTIVSLALSRAELLQNTRREAMLDGLTGLPNRRSFDKLIAECQTILLDYGEQYSLAMLDVDFFKNFNDTYGHQAGDEILLAVGQTLAEIGNDTSCIAARYGGEEFSLVMPGYSVAEAAEIAERARDAIENLDYPVKVTASFGVSGSELGMTSGAQLVAVADQALMTAKAHGRNRVEIATSTRGNHARTADRHATVHLSND